MSLLALLLACTGTKHSAGDDTSLPGHTDESGGGSDTSAAETDTGCGECNETSASPWVVSPADGSTWLVGDVVPLEPHTQGVEELRSMSWTVDGVEVATEAHAQWVAEGVGAHTVSFTLDACCGDGSDSVTIEIAEPAPPAVLTWDEAAGVPVASWYGLSVAGDGTVWGATSEGLVHFDPTTATTRVYTSADGLLTDTPRAVLAASDGTIWVGHVGDTKRQGEQVSVGEDGALTVLRFIDYTESTEITAVYRLREQPWGEGAGDIWMGTNEGLCLWDADLDLFSEHAHPTHPHGTSDGIAFTADGDVWNGDDYQLSRWQYSNDGSLSPSADLAEFWVPWPVEVKSPIYVTDLDVVWDGADWTLGGLWIASYSYGVSRVEVSPTVGASTTECLAEPFPASAYAIRGDGVGHLWIGAVDGLHVWDEAAGTMTTHDTADWLPSNLVQQIALDPGTVPPTTWLATPYGLVQVVGLGE